MKSRSFKLPLLFFFNLIPPNGERINCKCPAIKILCNQMPSSFLFCLCYTHIFSHPFKLLATQYTYLIHFQVFLSLFCRWTVCNEGLSSHLLPSQVLHTPKLSQDLSDGTLCLYFLMHHSLIIEFVLTPSLDC